MRWYVRLLERFSQRLSVVLTPYDMFIDDVSPGMDFIRWYGCCV